MAKIKQKTKRTAGRESLPFHRKNYFIFGVGVLFIILGYFALAQGPAESFSSLTIGPILLVIGYCVIVPLAILYRAEKQQEPEK